MDEAASEALEGSITRIVFQSEESGFSVVRLEPDHEEEITVVGKLTGIQPGERLRVRGAWTVDKKFGKQFRVESYLPLKPSTLVGIERYLGSGLIEGVGPAMAERLVKHFGLKTLEVIENAYHRLTEVEGIGRVRAEAVRTAWSEQKAVKEVMIFLQSHGISTAYAARIYDKFKDKSIEIVERNPYQLALDVFGIGFKKADAVAASIGLAVDSPVRVRAGILHALAEGAERGHVFLPRAELLGKSRSILGVGEDLIDEALARLVQAGPVIIEGDAVYLTALHAAEVDVAERIGRLVEAGTRGRLGKQAQDETAEATTRAIQRYEKKNGISLAAEQSRAIAAASTEKLLVITGGPGTGKTTIVKGILSLLKERSRKPALGAPTGRAAKRLTEATGVEAKTLHRLLEFDPMARRFTRDEGRPLEVDTLIIDEVSMVDIFLMQRVLSAVAEGSQLILVGDIDQLPSVGPGAILRDLLDSGRCPTIRLDRIYRQGEQSLIVENAHRINRGEAPVLPDAGNAGADFYLIERDHPERVLETMRQVIEHRIPQRFGLDPIEDIQVLTPMHRGSLGSLALNEMLQSTLNPEKRRMERGKKVFRYGDKIMQTRNNYELGVFNGDIGRVSRFDDDGRTLVARFDDRQVRYRAQELDELTLAYACSVHKSQGSEYPAVVVVLTSQHYVMLYRKLLYTAVTRARRLVVLIGDKRALSMAIQNQRDTERHAGLAARIRNGAHIDVPTAL